MKTKGCTCQSCGKKYQVDLMVPDGLWRRITPKPNEPGAGLLCGSCIMERIEKLSGWGVFKLTGAHTIKEQKQ